ncbi:MAG: TetR/AcrR family transcriptional regulator [Syntrophomonadaceae bacterium]|nr:TetR/AcrR family transcriptional regulator [Syntrophomonadaceae bacterium]MDD3022847.1 TetR/AcrR family transcriptional regulator [Syntrophomonadaceae bacterium]
MKDRVMQITRKEISRFGLRRFTMDDVAAQLGISKKTLYKFFASKSELIHDVLISDLQKDKEQFMQAIANEGNWFDKLSTALSFSGKSRISNDILQEVQLYFPEEEKLVNDFLVFQKEQIYQLFEAGLAKGEIEPWFDLDKLLIIIMEILRISSKQMSENGVSDQSGDMQEEIKKLIFFGLIKRTW